VREVPDQILIDLWEGIQDGTIRKPLRIFCPAKSAELLKEETEGATVIACDRLEDAVYQTWPELLTAS